MSLGFSPALRSLRAQSIVTTLDAGSAPGYINFYTGTRPSTGAAITSQVLVGTVTLGATSGIVNAGVITFAATTQDVSVDNDGTITWARMFDGDDVFVCDASCGLTGSGADFIFNTVNALSGGILKVNSGLITEGNA